MTSANPSVAPVRANALSHFWVGGWNQNSFYEIGGGALTELLDPEG